MDQLHLYDYVKMKSEKLWYEAFGDPIGGVAYLYVTGDWPEGGRHLIPLLVWQDPGQVQGAVST